MRTLTIGALARAVSVAVLDAPAGDRATTRFVPRIICLAAEVEAPAGLAPGWNPERYEMVAHQGRWSRWWWRLRSLPLIARFWPPPPLARLLVAARPGRVRITWGGIHADTSTFNDRT